MGWLLKGILCLCALGTCLPYGSAASAALEKTVGTLKMKVLVYDLVPLSQSMQQQVQGQVAQLYRTAGVEMEWLACATVAAEGLVYSGCAGQRNEAAVILRILPHIRKGMKADAAGEAISGARIVNVYWDRARYEANIRRMPPAQMLACIIAHEIGHLLLGPHSHSISGIMSGKWLQRDLNRIVQGLLEFTPSECALIHEELTRLQTEHNLKASKQSPED